jgi:4-amino-4-deoxy-L-arabinose transferase-like glycosyltransferase
MIKEYLQSKNFPCWLFIFSVLLLLTAPKLIQDGMFLDGMLYTCVSHNLSNGIGTFWSPLFSPSYNNSGSPFFHEHPPLVFGIQSLFFRVLGESMYVERFYIFLTMCITAFSINLLWKAVFKKAEELKKLSWLPVLFWITIPTCSWSYHNNMMENTMGIFALWAVILIFKAAESERNEIAALIFSGLFVFLATMSKGVPGFFPVSLPFLYWIVFRKKTLLKVILQTLLILSVPALLYFILFNIPISQESLSFYLTKRLLVRISDDPTVGNRFYILKRLFVELLPQIIFTIMIISVTKLKKSNMPLISNTSLSIFFLLAGFAAAGPLVLTMVQRGFYLVPSFPYFAIGFSILIAPVVHNFIEKSFSNSGIFKTCRIMSIVLFVFVIGFSLMQKGKTERDRDLLHDVHSIGNTIPKKSAITVNQDIANSYVLECYFIRYYDISLYIDEPKRYLMIKKSEEPVISSDFEKLNIDTKIYDVYLRKESR